MNVFMTVVVIYFTLGIISLGILELLTHRISKRIKGASSEAQLKLSDNGQFVGSKTAMILIIVALFLFYPAAIYAAIRWR